MTVSPLLDCPADLPKVTQKVVALQDLGLVVLGLHYSELLQSYPERGHFCGFLL